MFRPRVSRLRRSLRPQVSCGCSDVAASASPCPAPQSISEMKCSKGRKLPAEGGVFGLENRKPVDKSTGYIQSILLLKVSAGQNPVFRLTAFTPPPELYAASELRWHRRRGGRGGVSLRLTPGAFSKQKCSRWRRGRDLNPRYRFKPVYSLSRRAPSAGSDTSPEKADATTSR